MAVSSQFMKKPINSLVMVNFLCQLCQLGYIFMPRYLLRHYSGCFCEDAFWMKLIIKLVDSEQSWLLFIPPSKKEFCHSLTLDSNFNSCLGLQPPKLHMYLSKFFNIKYLLLSPFPLPPPIYTYTYTPTYT